MFRNETLKQIVLSSRTFAVLCSSAGEKQVSQHHDSCCQPGACVGWSAVNLSTTLTLLWKQHLFGIRIHQFKSEAS
jgi:hypothetical protein